MLYCTTMRINKVIVSALIPLTILTLIHNSAFPRENRNAPAKEEMEARYIFDLQRSDKFTERFAAIDFLFSAKRYDILVKNLEDSVDGRIRNEIIRRLGTLKDFAYLDLFVRYLDAELTDYVKTRLAALKAIENYQDKSVIPYFQEAVENDPSWEVRSRAAMAIANLGNENDMNKVIELFLNAENEEAELQIAIALGNMDVPLTSAALFDSWSSKSQSVMTAITYLMGIRNYADAKPVLLKKLTAKDDSERLAACFAVALFPDEIGEVTTAMRKFLFAKNPELRKRAIFYLALKNDTESIPTLQLITENPAEPAEIKKICYLALKQLGIIGNIDSVNGKQLVTSIGSRYGLKKKMTGQVVRKEPYYEVGSWPVKTLNSTHSMLPGAKEIIAAIKEEPDNFQVIFLFPPGPYLKKIYLELDLPEWVRQLMEKRDYVFTQ